MRTVTAPVATRLRVERLLGGSTLEPPALAPAAILVIRSLHDPLPGTLRVHTQSVDGAAQWQHALQGSLMEAWRTAARPARGAVPASTEAVLFDGPAEMLAAFARDVCSGAAHARWWWSALLRGLPGGVSVTALGALFARDARHVPAAIALLRAGGDAADVIAALPDDQVTRVLGAVAVAHELPALLRIPAAAARVIVAVHHEAGGSNAGPEPSPRDEPSPASGVPWRRVLPPAAVPASLSREQQALLGLCLALQHAPLLARDRAFIREFQYWRAGSSAHYTGTRPIDTSAPAPVPVRDVVQRETHSPEGLAFGEAAAPQGDAGPAVGTPVLTAGAHAGDSLLHHTAEPLRIPQPDVQRVAHVLPPEARSAKHAAPIDVHLPLHDSPVEVRSGICGAFFLINALRSVHWFDDARDRFPVSPFHSGWAWLELVARRLLRNTLPRDPLWQLLAELDGRTEPLSLEVQPHSVTTFLDDALPPLQLRIESGLRAAGDDDPLERALLMRRGRVQSSATHVDVHMHLDEVTLPVRVLGLDASPGWVPALARVLTLHYA